MDGAATLARGNVEGTSSRGSLEEGGHWKRVPGKFKKQALTSSALLLEIEQPSIETVPSLILMPPPCAIKGIVMETSSRGSLEVISRKIQNASTYPFL